jgi:hypothetical protein
MITETRGRLDTGRARDLLDRMDLEPGGPCTVRECRHIRTARAGFAPSGAARRTRGAAPKREDPRFRAGS